MERPIVFLSHISEEKELALEMKKLIETNFLDMLEVFVSSNESSISAGSHWLDSITNALTRCKIEIILCSSESIKRPWINFEAGAGWIRKIPVIPLCHSGMEPNRLPIPLNLLQAAKISEISSLKSVFPVLAQAIGAKTPSIDFTDFVKKVSEFEVNYTFWDKCNLYFEILNKINAQIINGIKNNSTNEILLHQKNVSVIENDMAEFFEKNNIVKISRTGSAIYSENGIFYGYNFLPLSNFKNTISDNHFIYK